MHLTGRDSELTEQRIGEWVFERPEGYRPGDDNIVRNYARLLRQRLDGSCGNWHIHCIHFRSDGLRA